jgi:hypothetical protein
MGELFNLQSLAGKVAMTTDIFLKIITMLWVITAAVAGSASAQVSDVPTLSLHTFPVQDEKLLVVNIELKDAVEVYGVELKLHYDPTQLQVRDSNPGQQGTQIIPGPLLGVENRFIIRNTADTETGQISFAFTPLNPAPPISGEGVLATIEFEVVGEGPFMVEFDKTQLVALDLQPIPAAIENLSLEHLPAPDSQTPKRESPTTALIFTPWQWGVIGGSVGLLIIVLLLTLRRMNSPAASLPTPARRMPGSGQTPGRNAALLTEQGNQALSQGEVQKAYDLFSRAVERDPLNVQAWLGKGLVAQQTTEKRICFQRVLALDPNNATAQAGLQQLEDNA